jgi:poly-gamma-glutamate capsule biosynthesis protein CapA/YwtB (metallophosphatase superfamily)
MGRKNIQILGDLAPLGQAKASFLSGDSDWFTDELGLTFKGADFTFVNLECPLIHAEFPIQKLGPALGVKTDSANALKNFSLVGLANNHIYDHGEVGVKHTLEILDKSNISHLGAGMNLSSAGKPRVVNLGDVTVGFLAWSHHEFCIATESSAGAFPIDLRLGLGILEDLQQKCDFVILFYHGGVEHFPYPTLEQRANCQFFAERGVDLIVCQHSHIIGASEVVGDSTILYGQGNYCFDLKGKESLTHWNQGLMLDVDLQVGKPLQVEFVPIVQDTNNGMRPRRADPETSAAILEKQKYFSETLSNPDDFEQLWSAYTEQQANHFLYGLLPVGRYIRKALKVFGLMPIIWGRKELLRVINRMECEAHSDVIVTGLKNILNRRKNK